ncbi:Uncharacterised protein [Vibrio cholerae]|nr:Uncharacterised protein [Vibrio cholerae]
MSIPSVASASFSGAIFDTSASLTSSFSSSRISP